MSVCQGKKWEKEKKKSKKKKRERERAGREMSSSSHFVVPLSSVKEGVVLGDTVPSSALSLVIPSLSVTSISTSSVLSSLSSLVIHQNPIHHDQL
jgi:hypothetical protein